MKPLTLVKRSTLTRFSIIGLFNALLTFSLLNALYFYVGTSKRTSSLIATGVAMLFSFFLNRIFVFKSETREIRKQFLRFIIVTALGSFVVLNGVYSLCVLMADALLKEQLTSLAQALPLGVTYDVLVINASTVMGALCAMAVNYNGYRLFVFKTEDSTDRNHEEG